MDSKSALSAAVSFGALIFLPRAHFFSSSLVFSLSFIASRFFSTMASDDDDDDGWEDFDDSDGEEEMVDNVVVVSENQMLLKGLRSVRYKRRRI